MIAFWITALGFCLMAMAFIVLPLYYLTKASAEALSAGTLERDSFNVSIFEERLAEYQTQLDQHAISQEEFSQLERDLQGNLLSEAAAQHKVAAAAEEETRFGLPLIFAALVPLLALASYADFGLSWGSISDVALAREIQSSNPHDTAGMLQMVTKLASHLDKQPDNPDSWFLLAQSRMQLQQYEEAVSAFKHLLEFYPRNPNLSSYYAEAIYMADDRRLTERAQIAVDEALLLNPHDITMLEIRAVGLFQAGDPAAAAGWLRKALAAGPGTRRARFIKGAIASIEQNPGKDSAFEASLDPPRQASNQPANRRSLQVLVEVADAVEVSASAAVFVFARPASGPPMPLAVRRLLRGELPTIITLDESMAMMTGMGLASFDQVQVVARISSSGIANVSPDDYEALSATIDLTREQGMITLILENRVRDK